MGTSVPPFCYNETMNFLYENQIKEKSKTAVIMCTYKRFANLSGTYKNMSDQTNKDFDFYICENSGNDPHILNTTNKCLSFINFNLFIEEYNNKYSIFSRFHLARDLAKNGYERIVFIDDDQVIPNNFIQDCYNQYEEDTVKSFYAHIIVGDYWKKEALDHYEEGNYVGGGGLLCSSKLFLEEGLFECPEEYLILDDLWLSYYLANFTKYKMKRLNTLISFINDDKATAIGLKKEKREFSSKYITKTYKDDK
jgi:hypothetical protein